MATGFAPHPSRAIPRGARHPLSTDPGYNPILPIGGEKERVLMRFLADQPYASGGECPPSPPRSLLASNAASNDTRDWWGTPDDGTGPCIAGETWCGECLVVVNAGPLRCSYQWQRQAPGESPPESIPGATGPRYVVTEDDLGCKLRCVVSRTRMRPDTKGIGPSNATSKSHQSQLIQSNADPSFESSDASGEEIHHTIASSESVATHAPYHYANGGPTGLNDVVALADSGLTSSRHPGSQPVPHGAAGSLGHARAENPSPAGAVNSPRREIVLKPPHGGGHHVVEATFALGCQREGEGHELSARGLNKEANEKYEEAERCYRTAADSDGGHCLARCRLGRMIEQGWGCDPDPNAAAALYRDAAKEGCAEAENNLGALLYLGMATDTSIEGPRGDPDEDAANAAALFHRARSRGLGAACSNLALCYEEGRGVRGGQDLDRARALYDEAARGGVVSAFAGCGSVALMRGDLRDAVASFRVGAAQGSDDASERLRALTLRHRRGKALVGVAAAAAAAGESSKSLPSNRLGSGTDLGTIRSEPDTSRAPSMQASDDVFDEDTLELRTTTGDGETDTELTYEREVARYHRLSQVLFDRMVGSGDPALARAAEEAVREAFPEMNAHHRVESS